MNEIGDCAPAWRSGQTRWLRRSLAAMLLGLVALCPTNWNSVVNVENNTSVRITWRECGVPLSTLCYTTLRAGADPRVPTETAWETQAVQETAHAYKRIATSCGLARRTFLGWATFSAAEAFERGATESWYFSPVNLVGDWLMVCAAGGLVLWARRLARGARRQRRAARGECVVCGYNLTGNVSGRCPECGHPIAHAAPTDGAAAGG